LATIDFAGRYYALTKREPAAGRPWTESKADHEKIIASLGLAARYFKKEGFFRCEEKDGDIVSWLHLTFRGGVLEMGFYVNTPAGNLGGTAHGLAKSVAKRVDPNFSRKPPYPRVPYGSRDEVVDAIRECVVLFRQVKRAALEAEGYERS
jgi:hypothetical protein